MKIALGLGCDRGTAAETIAQAIAQALAACVAQFADAGEAMEVAAVDVPNPSATVKKYTGTPSVSEAAALLAAACDKTSLLIEKHKLRGPDGRNATVSIARISP